MCVCVYLRVHPCSLLHPSKGLGLGLIYHGKVQKGV